MTVAAASDPGIEAVARFLGKRTGLAFTEGRREDIAAGIERAMRRARVTDPARYLELLVGRELGLDDLIAEVTVGETYFFRDPAQFEVIRARILPELVRRRGPRHVLRLWSAGCASGEEAYSLAILASQAGLGDRCRIRATDLSPAALARAREGSYGDWSLRGVDAATRNLHFREEGGRWRLDEAIARRVDFELLNLALDAYPSAAAGIWGEDLILCRNVLIYLDRDAIARVALGLHATLAEGGWLITGASDPPLEGVAPFEAVVTPAGVAYQRAERRRGAASRAGGALRPPAPAPPPPPPAFAIPPPASLPTAPEPGPAPERDRLADARAALERGAYDQVLALTEGSGREAAAAALRLRAIANRTGSAEAVLAAAAELGRHPLSSELHFLNAVLLLDLGRDREAEQAVRRVIYLDRTLAVAHHLLGSILRRRGDAEGARRAYRNARDLAAARPAEEGLALGDGERASRLAAAASAELLLLGERAEVAP